MNEPKPCKLFFRPNFALYHATSKGNGCALKMALHPAHDDTDGSIWLTLSNQCGIGNRNADKPIYPRFDWENSVTVKLDFTDLCQILQVLRGECEEIGDGKGIYHTSAVGTTSIMFRHIVDPIAGYSLDVYRTYRSGKEDGRFHFLFKPAEAMGVCEAIADSMGIVAFGIPIVQAHEQRENRNVVAA